MAEPVQNACKDVHEIRQDPAWVPCTDCDEFWCNVHEQHAFDCPCPPIEDWTCDPYTTGARAQRDDAAAVNEIEEIENGAGE